MTDQSPLMSEPVAVALVRLEGRISDLQKEMGGKFELLTTQVQHAHSEAAAIAKLVDEKVTGMVTRFEDHMHEREGTTKRIWDAIERAEAKVDTLEEKVQKIHLSLATRLAYATGSGIIGGGLGYWIAQAVTP